MRVINNSVRENRQRRDTLKVNSRAGDPESARIKSGFGTGKNNEYQQNGSLTLAGTPQLTAGNKIELSGFGQLSGDWLITSTRHVFERNSGYTTELEVARGPGNPNPPPTGQTGKTQTLTVYKADGSTSTVIKEKNNGHSDPSGRYRQCRGCR